MMDEDASNLLKKMPIENLILGIGDVAAATGVSQSQIRYWESKGYIHSEASNDGKNRKFSYKTVLKVQQIKTYLDDGYTLVGAAKQSQRRSNYFDTLRSFFEGRFVNMAIDPDSQQASIDLGPFDPEPGKSLIAERIDDHWHFKLIDAKN
ncbi:MerR family transcriptional regulator [Levilactobacillus angrenensis]|uniref:MerR family transcriptional regulator n=1 Tax=Levilactobacillus angrenensis TaxID=2486020 RepID=A0ABW1UCN0_9LACO|nr:MerR family transcriptional regulator [Levilactobacillus angrenensis]